MDMIKKDLADIIPYENNPRKNDQAVDAVAESIRQCGYVAPIIVDENNVILAGHTRLKAMKKLGMTECEVVVKEGLTGEQKKKYRLLDNKTAELSEWDFEKLAEEIDGLDFGELNLDWGIDNESEESDTKYTDAANIPQYEPDLDNPAELTELTDVSKQRELLERIENATISDEEKEFLRIAAMRHVRFNYGRIADYYAQASREMQELMEDSALVIIDVDNAIRDGYAVLSSGIKDCL